MSINKAGIKVYGIISAKERNRIECMIKKVRVCNFKCYGPRGADFNLSRVNFIFGDNSSGKSTFLQFLMKIGEICNLDGKCRKDDLDKHLFKNQQGGISAKVRVVHGTGDAGGVEVWSFGVSKSNCAEYELIDSHGSLVNREKLLSVLPARQGESIVHVVANRATSKELTKDEGEFEKRFENRIDVETSETSRDYVNDILKRLGVPYSCVVDEKDDRISAVKIHDDDFAIDLPLEDVGTGIEGLVRLALTLNGWRSGILAIEEPETNVGEMQMEALARVLVEEALKRDDGQLIVECHSKIMAMKIIELVKSGVLTCGEFPNSNLSVMVVEKLPEGSIVKNVRIDGNGDMDWPRGFFPAEGNLLRNAYGMSK